MDNKDFRKEAPPSPTPIEPEKKATSDETVSDILEVQLQKEIEFYRERMNRAMYELNIGTKASCFQILYDALLDDRQPSAPTSTAGEEVPEEYWKQVIAEIRIASLPPDTNETINHIIRQPSTIRLAKFIVAKTNEVIQMYVDVADDQQTCIDKFRAENTALRSKVEALEKEREGYREMLEQMQGWVQIKNLLAKYPPSQEP
jgi:hypothetical protein